MANVAEQVAGNVDSKMSPIDAIAQELEATEATLQELAKLVESSQRAKAELQEAYQLEMIRILRRVEAEERIRNQRLRRAFGPYWKLFDHWPDHWFWRPVAS